MKEFIILTMALSLFSICLYLMLWISAFGPVTSNSLPLHYPLAPAIMLFTPSICFSENNLIFDNIFLAKILWEKKFLADIWLSWKFVKICFNVENVFLGKTRGSHFPEIRYIFKWIFLLWKTFYFLENKQALENVILVRLFDSRK